MTTRVYPIHRAIGRPVVFKGLKGPYIIIAGLSLVTDLLLFVILYVSGVWPWVCILLVFGVGAVGLSTTAKLSRRYGPYGLQRRMAAKRLTIRIDSRRVFLNLPKIMSNENNEEEAGFAGNRVLRPSAP